MNKGLVESLIPIARKKLKDNSFIYKDGKISSTLKGNIAAFGAAVQMGNLLSAVAFFSQQGGAAQPRQELLSVIFEVLKEHKDVEETYMTLFDYVCDVREQDMMQAKELVISAAVAIKLAMNLFELEKPGE